MRTSLLLTGVIALATLRNAAVNADEGQRPKRAKPPTWTQDVLDAFFEDAREHLVGERPATTVKGAAPPPVDDRRPVQPAGEFAWSQVVDGETLATEVKRVVAGLREPLANPGKFKAGGYKQCRADFSWLAVLFGVIAEYDGDVRWKTDAPALRAGLARAGQNCKTATDQTFAEATARKTDLDDLVRGDSLGGGAGESEKWSSLADRVLLMQRMERGLQEGISPKVASAALFKKSLGDVRHEAELLAVLADVIVREEYEYWDDVAFREHARELQSAVSEVRRAVKAESYEAARAAAGRAGQACSDCHEGYRG